MKQRGGGLIKHDECETAARLCQVDGILRQRRRRSAKEEGGTRTVRAVLQRGCLEKSRYLERLSGLATPGCTLPTTGRQCRASSVTTDSARNDSSKRGLLGGGDDVRDGRLEDERSSLMRRGVRVFFLLAGL